MQIKWFRKTRNKRTKIMLHYDENNIQSLKAKSGDIVHIPALIALKSFADDGLCILAIIQAHLVAELL
jgi:hypothetical protein